jgi:hypothetical protein
MYACLPLMALFIWLIIRLIQLVFSAGTVFFSHKKSANSVFQPAYNSSYELLVLVYSPAISASVFEQKFTHTCMESHADMH